MIPGGSVSMRVMGISGNPRLTIMMEGFDFFDNHG